MNGQYGPLMGICAVSRTTGLFYGHWYADNRKFGDFEARSNDGYQRFEDRQGGLHLVRISHYQRKGCWQSNHKAQADIRGNISGFPKLNIFQCSCSRRGSGKSVF